MPSITDIDAHAIEIPLRSAFVTSQDAVQRTVARIISIDITLDDGYVAKGEAAPVTYVTGETHDSVLRDSAIVKRALIGMDASRIQPLCHTLRSHLPTSHTACAGIEMALYDAFTRCTGTSLWHHMGAAQISVDTDLTLSIVADAADKAQKAVRNGFTCLKMKVGGGSPASEVERISMVQRAAPNARIRLDANQAFNAASALELINRSLEAHINLELVEQPVPKEDLAALDKVSETSPVPIVADEAVQSPEDALRLVCETRVHGLNVKVMKAGITGARDIIAIAQAAKRKLMIGCMLESNRSTAVSLAIACGTGAFNYIDLDAPYLLNEVGKNPYFTANGPHLTLLF